MEKENDIKKNKSGFTLIELLAVIIIMAVLLMAALPAVTRAIAQSRRRTFATNAKRFVDAARTSIVDEDLAVMTAGIQHANTTCQTPGFGSYVAVPIDKIFLERGGDKSSFGQAYSTGYVIIANDGATGDKFNYYFIGIDEGNHGVDDFVLESELGAGSVKNGNASLGDKTNAVSSCSSLSLPTASGNKTFTCSAVCEEME